MNEFIFIPKEELQKIIEDCVASQNREKAPSKEQQQTKYLHSIKELAEFLGWSIVTAQKLKNSGKVRYRQFGRKLIFVASEVLEDIEKSGKRTSK